MKFVQWILSILGAFYCLILFVAVFRGDVLPFVFALIALILIAPPLYPQINKRLPWLRAGFLKIFLCVVLWFTSLAFLGTTTVGFASAAVCANPSNGVCAKSDIAVLETTSSLAVTAELRETSTSNVKQVNITMDYWPEPDQESEVYSQVFDAPQDQQSMLFTLEELTLRPGSYRLNITPVTDDDKDPLTKKVQFAVWTSAEDVEKRNSGELKNAGLFHNSVADVKICEHSGERGTFCKEHMPQIASKVPALGFTADIPNLKIRRSRLRGDSQITFVLRLLNASGEQLTEPEEIFRETQELEGNVGTYTLINASPAGGLPVGEFELVTSLEAKDSLPIRKTFTIK